MSDILVAMADGIGELEFASRQWIREAREVVEQQAAAHREGLADIGTFTLCEVAHNPPAYLRVGTTLAWHARFDGDRVVVSAGELPDDECDFKVEGDHGVFSNLARLQYHGRDPAVVASAQAQLAAQSRWKLHGEISQHPVLGSVLRALHDHMAARTLPKFTWMTPEWVSIARHIISTRAQAASWSLRNVTFTFAEEFTGTPAYAFPDGASGGFWVVCKHGQVTVGSGALPAEFAPADFLNRGLYVPVVPVGRTVNARMNDADRKEQEAYLKAAFGYDKALGRRAMEDTPKAEMPAALGRVMGVLHDELSQRSSGELPADFDDSIKPVWATPQAFDRDPGYETWLRYDVVDVRGQPRG